MAKLAFIIDINFEEGGYDATIFRANISRKDLGW